MLESIEMGVKKHNARKRSREEKTAGAAEKRPRSE